MTHRRLSPAICCMMVVLSGATASTASDDDLVEKRIKQLIHARDLWRHDEACSRLLRSLTPAEVRHLRGHAHDTVALAAAWHEVQ